MGVAALCIAAIVSASLAHFRAFSRIDAWSYDSLQRLRPQQTDNSLHVVLVTIDEESIGVLGEWPWKRSIHADLIDKLYDAEAAIVGVDILFLEASSDSEADQALAAALERHPSTVLAAKVDSATRNYEGADVQTGVVQLKRPYKLFREQAHYGLVNVDNSEPGGVIRHFQPGFTHQDQVYPAFATAVYSSVFQREPDLPKLTPQYINYRGGPNSFPSVPAYQVLSGQAAPELFRNAIVLIGPTYSDSQDFHPIPLRTKGGVAVYMNKTNLAPGVEIHANILTTLIGQGFIHDTPRWVQTLVALLVALIVGYLMLFRSALVVSVSSAIIAILAITVSYFLLDSLQLTYDPSYPIAAIAITIICVAVPVRQPLVLQTKVGPYHLYEELGRGGMAVVYRARHPRTGNIVALKQMLPQYSADKDSLTRFVREIELIRSLDHPNIIAIIDHGDVDGQPYYAMEYIQGDTLEDLQKERKTIDGSNVRRYAGAIARALAQAHAIGVIHRDIKPSNIMLTRTGEPKLTDFGIAKKSNAPQLTQTGQIVGTPFYMAPELLKGYKASPQSDIYSLGATMYHLLSGRPIFQSDEIQTILTMVLFDDATDIRRHAPDVDDELAELVMQCIAKEPEDRPASMVEVAKRLDPFYTGVITMPPGQQADVQIDAPTPMPGGVHLDAPTTIVDRPTAGKTSARHLNPAVDDSADSESPRTFVMKPYEPPPEDDEDDDDDEFGPPPPIPPIKGE